VTKSAWTIYYNFAREGRDRCALHLCERRNLYRIDSAHSGNSRVKARTTARPVPKPHAGSLCLPRVDFTQLANAFDREWLVTNGLGGFACGTVALANTRRYHGLLVASLSPPVQRVLMLAKLDVTVRHRGITFELGCSEFADGTVTPRGFELLTAFRLAEGMPARGAKRLRPLGPRLAQSSLGHGEIMVGAECGGNQAMRPFVPIGFRPVVKLSGQFDTLLRRRNRFRLTREALGQRRAARQTCDPDSMLD
jgi:hypothetical protein